MTAKTTRAPRKTRIADVIDAPVKRSFFDQLGEEIGVTGLTGKRYVAGVLASLLTGYALGTYVVGPIMAAFFIGAVLLDWPLLIILLGYVIMMAYALYYGSIVCSYMGELVILKKVDAMYFVARDKVSSLFNFRKEVTA